MARHLTCRYVRHHPARNVPKFTLPHMNAGGGADCGRSAAVPGPRVSNQKSINHEYNPPPMMMPPGEAEKKRDTRYLVKYEYKYDAKGNWIKRTTKEWDTKDGRSFYEPSYVTYRRISYY